MPNKKLREYGSPVGFQEPSNTNVGRPQVGPADAATRSAALKKALAATEPAPVKPEVTPSEEDGTRSLALDQAARNLRKTKVRMYDLDHDQEVK